MSHGQLPFQPPAPPHLAITPTHMDVFMFSAITWNRHHVHYDAAAAKKEGLPGVVVQRALIGNYFVRLLTDWVGERAEVRKINWRMLGSAVPGDTLSCHGEVTSVDNGWLTCALTMSNERGDAIASATATLWISQPF